MNVTHTIRVLLDDGRCQRHYVEAKRDGDDTFGNYMYYAAGEWVGWKVDNCFYLRENVTGFGIEPFKGIVVMVDGYSVVVEEMGDLCTAIQAQIGARLNEIDALKGYLTRGMPNPDILNIKDAAAQEVLRKMKRESRRKAFDAKAKNVHSIQGHEEVSPNLGDEGTEGSDSPDPRQDT